MYENHFSLKHKPFDLVPNPDFLFLSSTHQKAITYLDYGIKEKIGFIFLTGEIGCGKTTIIRNLIKHLDGSVRISRINNTKVSSEQLISMVNEDFGLDTEGKNKIRLLSELNEFLIDQYAKKNQPILLIDEAQNLTPDLLEEVRLLSNLETDRAKLLQIILVGQPELKRTLMLPELMQLRQRINISYHIAPLTLDETSAYIRHRLTVAGNPDVMKLQNDMLEPIYRFSRGIPRLINIICDFALLSAYTEGRKEVTVETVREVAADLEAGEHWNDSPAVNTSGGGKTQEDAGLGEVVLRLMRLEETVRNNVSELISLSNKIIQLENYASGPIKIPGKSGSVNGDLPAENRNQLHLLEGRIESAAEIIGHINEKLKGL
ncbi:MAG: AAA family ATPase [Nitrospiraceae bacterium]|nr:MAG: AAA family ATPase [Nitrospiraceae bacterium]